MNTSLNGAFVKKYAPETISDVVLADAAVESAIQRYATGRDMRPLVLYGPNGTGKTTLAKLLAMELLGDAYDLDVYEIDPFRWHSDVKLRNYILGILQTQPMSGSQFRIFMMDEFDLFAKGLIKTFKNLMDRSDDRVLYIATTNDLKALDKGHRSRAVCLPIVQAPLERWVPRIKTILETEHVPVPKDQLLLEMLDNSGGDNRQFLADLQQYVEEYKAVQMETV